MTSDTITSPVLLGLGGLYVFLAVASPRAALFLLLPTIALAPEAQVGQVVFRPDDLMLSVLAISWGLRRLAGAARQATPLDRPLIAYLAVGIAATLWGAAIGTADLTSLNKYSASGLHLLKRLEFVLYFFILRDTVRSTADAQRLAFALIVSLVGLSLYAFGRFQETGTLARGPSGTPVHEPGLASLLNVALSLGFLVVPGGGAAKSAAAVLVLLFSLYTLPFGLGRNYLASTVALFTIVALWRKRSALLLFPIAAAVVWLVDVTLYPQNVVQRFLTLGSAFTSSSQASPLGVSLIDRFRPGIEYGLQVLTSSPLLGWGPGSVALGSIDSEYSGQLTYTGILGFAVFAWLVVRLVRMAREAYKEAKAKGSPALPLIMGLQHCLLGYGIYSTFSPSISAARAGAFFFTIVGLLAVLHREVVLAAAPEAATATDTYGMRVGRLEGGAVQWTT